jgi:hypothetical protein
MEFESPSSDHSEPPWNQDRQAGGEESWGSSRVLLGFF